MFPNMFRNILCLKICHQTNCNVLIQSVFRVIQKQYLLNYARNTKTFTYSTFQLSLWQENVREEEQKLGFWTNLGKKCPICGKKKGFFKMFTIVIFVFYNALSVHEISKKCLAKITTPKCTRFCAQFGIKTFKCGTRKGFSKIFTIATLVYL